MNVLLKFGDTLNIKKKFENFIFEIFVVISTRIPYHFLLEQRLKTQLKKKRNKKLKKTKIKKPNIGFYESIVHLCSAN